MDAENKTLETMLLNIKRDIPVELNEYLASVSLKIEQECTMIVDPDERHEQQKVPFFAVSPATIHSVHTTIRCDRRNEALEYCLQSCAIIPGFLWLSIWK